MKITKDTYRYIEDLVTAEGIEWAWKSTLKTHAHHQGFINITESAEFSDAIVFNEDILDSLGYNGVGVLYQYALSVSSNASKKETGAFYTPEDIADIMAARASTFPDGIWLDPCAGTGNLVYSLCKSKEDPETFLRGHMIVSDIDPLALLTARTLLSMSFQTQGDLFNDLKPSFINHDFLDDPEPLGDFDYVIMNPPYVSGLNDARFETAECGDSYAYFIEQALRAASGVVSITPQSFTHSERFKSLRAYILSHTDHASLVSFDNMPSCVFRGVKFGSENTNKVVSVRPTIMVASGGIHEQGRWTSPLLRWNSSERSELLEHLDNLSTKTEFSDDLFPKVGRGMGEFYAWLVSENTTRLGEIISSSKTDFMLYLATTPRYFISAAMEPLERSSLRTLYFSNEKDRDTAYFLLNTSYAYWWWRIADGGMSLTGKTIFSLPVPIGFTPPSEMIEQMRESEKNSKVFAKNGGKIQENIKHPMEKVKQWNHALLTEDICEIMETEHTSSSLEKLKAVHGEGDVANAVTAFFSFTPSFASVEKSHKATMMPKAHMETLF